MIKVVLDTNIIVSAALSPKGNPAKIINIIADTDEVQIYYSMAIIDEYQEVLSRERLKIAVETQICITRAIKEIGILIEPAASDMPLPDEGDRIFYDTSKTAGAYLITGNRKHYPDEPHILTPAQFIRMVVAA